MGYTLKIVKRNAGTRVTTRAAAAQIAIWARARFGGEWAVTGVRSDGQWWVVSGNCSVELVKG